MKLNELIAASVNVFASEFLRTGYVAAGSNGPRGHGMTSIRNAGHWLYAVCVVNSWEPRPLLTQVAERLRDQLLSPVGRPYGFTHKFREARGFDGCGGIIGPAWVIESLVKAGHALNDERCLDLAEELFFLHEFSDRKGLWHARETDGKVLDIDRTFDHQLWFAACASEIYHHRRAELAERVQRFLECVPENMIVRENGRICHAVKDPRTPLRMHASRLKIKLTQALKIDMALEYSTPAEIVEVGYHAFSMYAFAILATQFSKHPTFVIENVRKATQYLHSTEYIRLLDDNIFGYPYNPPGFEVPFSLSVLSDISEETLVQKSTFWANEQIRRTYDYEKSAMSFNTADPETLSARIYEATRLPYSLLARIEIIRDI